MHVKMCHYQQDVWKCSYFKNWRLYTLEMNHLMQSYLISQYITNISLLSTVAPILIKMAASSKTRNYPNSLYMVLRVPLRIQSFFNNRNYREISEKT